MSDQDKLDKLAEWLLAEANAIEAQHKTLGDDRLILQGRHEAADFVLQKIAQLNSVEQEAIDATSTSSEPSEPEG